MSSCLRSLVAVLSAVMLASLEPGCSHMPVKGEPSPDDCARARSQRTAGTVLGMTGVVAVGTGMVLLATNQHHSTGFGVSIDGRDVGGAAAILGGAILTLVGVGIAGAPLTAISRCNAAEGCRSGLIAACNLLDEPRP